MDLNQYSSEIEFAILVMKGIWIYTLYTKWTISKIPSFTIVLPCGGSPSHTKPKSVYLSSSTFGTKVFLLNQDLLANIFQVIEWKNIFHKGSELTGLILQLKCLSF
jgi:hypothetical protein